MKRFVIVFVIVANAEAATEELAKAVVALEYGVDELPESAIVLEVPA